MILSVLVEKINYYLFIINVIKIKKKEIIVEYIPKGKIYLE